MCQDCDCPGSDVALIPPFRDGIMDEAALWRLVDWQFPPDYGRDALVPFRG